MAEEAGHELLQALAGTAGPPRVAVVGLGTSNRAVLRWLLAKGVPVIACDQKSPQALEGYGELARLPLELWLGPDYLAPVERADLLILTPGIRKDLPQLEAAQARGARLTCETDLFFSLCPAPIVGITGTSGKTTTTTLVGEMLRRSGVPALVGGNIGRPLIELAEHVDPASWVVLELSSFQLELHRKSPQVAVVTTLTPNHLDVHPSMEAYVAAKRRILEFQSLQDAAVLNWDQEAVRALASSTPAQVYWFSRERAVERGAFEADGALWLRLEPDRLPQRIVGVEEIRLPGVHNRANLLAAAVAASLAGASLDGIREVARTFRGVRHRLEPVGVVAGVEYINDSIATTPERAVVGIRAMNDRPLHLIAGGYDKRLPFEPLAHEVVRSVQHLYLMGVTAPKIAEAVRREARRTGLPGPAIHRVQDLEEAVALARRLARPGERVLLSPACASFDQFANFEERGDRFRELVAQLGSRGPAAAGGEEVHPL
ncbi:UDP-N-acetylmuramoyl-L-alanine--D-glutamate ligase [Limnochorda sp.]|uniref:UDP-N-acetylmuramoyl-L-alanine--D-glutamate ligase n=1 Tax=Limnochorda sp. TaxID=1940279 RepID=UPI001DEA0579|nr:UDP-N-acetylmuramoyl-L-alanine--D-glutamate ligase [Bacillota bacterium]MBO2518336.1 UDP-N-acetylmuramoyl-L-alanine--D-glutamate ligase [Bacillota bacterium]